MHQAQLQEKIECKEQMKLLLICDEIAGGHRTSLKNAETLLLR